MSELKSNINSFILSNNDFIGINTVLKKNIDELEEEIKNICNNNNNLTTEDRAYKIDKTLDEIKEKNDMITNMNKFRCESADRLLNTINQSNLTEFDKAKIISCLSDHIKRLEKCIENQTLYGGYCDLKEDPEFESELLEFSKN